MDTQITYELEQPIEYAKGGDLEEAKFITLSAPTSRNMAELAFLKQAFFRALPKDGAVEAEQEGDGEAKLTGDAVMTLITMSDVDLSSVLATGRELLTSGVALVGGEQKLTKPLADNLSMDDLGNMIGEYMANFILASALRRLKAS